MAISSIFWMKYYSHYKMAFPSMFWMKYYRDYKMAFCIILWMKYNSHYKMAFPSIFWMKYYRDYKMAFSSTFWMKLLLQSYSVKLLCFVCSYMPPHPPQSNCDHHKIDFWDTHPKDKKKGLDSKNTTNSWQSKMVDHKFLHCTRIYWQSVMDKSNCNQVWRVFLFLKLKGLVTIDWVTSLHYKAGILGSNPLHGRKLESVACIFQTGRGCWYWRIWCSMFIVDQSICEICVAWNCRVSSFNMKVGWVSMESNYPGVKSSVWPLQGQYWRT